MDIDRIRKIRLSYGMSQSAFAAALHVSQQLVHFWETGFRQPSDYHLAVLQRLEEMSNSAEMKIRALAGMQAAQRDLQEKGLVVLGLGILLASLFGTVNLGGQSRAKRRQGVKKNRPVSRAKIALD